MRGFRGGGTPLWLYDIPTAPKYDEAAVRVSKWGNSLAVRLPKALAEQLGLKQGGQLNVVAAREGAIEVETRQHQRRRALERMAARHWTFPRGSRFDRDEADER
jgi:antitoxin MazE